MFYVYVLVCDSGEKYIGFTADLKARVQAHREATSGWTATRQN